MKISKLFHWLYAILMLLPFAFFIPSVFYYAFNDNATMQSVEVPKTETISVAFNQKSRNGNFATNEFWNVTGTTYTVDNGYLELDLGNVSGTITPYNISCNFIVNDLENHIYMYKYDYYFGYNENAYGVDMAFPFYQYNTLTRDNQWHTCSNRFTATYNYNGNIRILPYFRNGTDYSGKVFRVTNIQLFDLTEMFGSGNEPTLDEFNLMFPNAYYPYTESELMQITYDTGETVQLVENTSIVNYAWDSIWDLPLFNWCKVSFVSVPFTYITGLFGLAASNSFNYVFTYFASMSIIWLVFDVIMYVPLLTHRWLDKGIVE